MGKSHSITIKVNDSELEAIQAYADLHYTNRATITRQGVLQLVGYKVIHNGTVDHSAVNNGPESTKTVNHDLVAPNDTHQITIDHSAVKKPTIDSTVPDSVLAEMQAILAPLEAITEELADIRDNSIPPDPTPSKVSLVASRRRPKTSYTRELPPDPNDHITIK